MPDPGSDFELTRNAAGSGAQCSRRQGWTIDYDRYMPVGGDVLPARLVLRREDARVRIAVDRWERWSA